MHKMTEANLEAAFAGESQAHMKYLVFADRAEAVCRRYLSAGRRSGDYWTVGDLSNNKGKSLYVRL